MGRIVLVALMGLISAGCLVAYFKVRKGNKTNTSNYGADRTSEYVLGGIGGALALLLVVIVLTSSIVVVPATANAVIKSTADGSMRVVQGGWQTVNPFFEQAVIYNLQVQEFQIGEPNVKDQNGVVTEVKAVEADSNSAGRPVVFLTVTGRFQFSNAGCPGPECDLIRIERKYGIAGWEALIKDRMEMIVRETAGQNPYNYVGDSRAEFAEVAATRLKEELVGLATVENVGIPWYDFSKFINDQLDQVAQQERQNEQKTQELKRERIETDRILEVKMRSVQESEQTAKEQKIREEGNLIAAQIAAEADSERRRIAADIAAYEVEIKAQAEAAGVTVRAVSEAERIRLVTDAEAAAFKAKLRAFDGNAQAFVEWTKANRWSGALPITLAGSDTAIPFLDLAK